MNTLIARYAAHWGYEPTPAELYDMYAVGDIWVTDSEENALIAWAQAN